MYIVIVGAGGLGKKVAELALKDGNDVVVIDKNEQKCESITQEYDLISITGDATQKKTLEDAEVPDADAVVTTVDDATNLMVISLAKDMGVNSLVSLVKQAESKNMLEEKGATIVGNPDQITAEYLYRAIHRPKVEDFLPLSGEAEIFKVTLPENSKLAGKKLNKIREEEILPREASVIAIERDTEVIIPHKGVTLKEGDSITVLAKENVISEIMEILEETEETEEKEEEKDERE